MLRTKVILLNATNLSDARYAAGMGVDYIGFSINPVSNNYVTAEDANTIIEWLSGVSVIGDLGSSMADFESYKVDYILTDNQNLIENLDEPILTLPISSQNSAIIRELFEQNVEKVAFFILKIAKEEFATFKEEIQYLTGRFECYLSIDLDTENLHSVLETAPRGVVLYGSHEERPGLSNYDGIADVLELLDEL